MTVTIPAVRKVVFVPLEPAAAFSLFTDRMADWWPLGTHSVGGHDARTVTFEPGVGGRIIETMTSGATADWGTVLAWDPPLLVRFAWHPGSPPDEATDVEVAFFTSDGGTRVELVHTGWDRRPDGADARTGYDSGWDLVLGLYASRD